MAMVEADLLSQTYIYMRERSYSITDTIIIVQTNIHHRSKVFTTGQATVNHEHYVTKCVGGRCETNLSIFQG